VQGVPFKSTAKLAFPKTDPANPEIDRMWASHRIDGLLRQADRSGSRASVADQVIQLGEGYSIVTEYTSFLVLENDGEYQRWKIERRNGLRTERDRKAQEWTRTGLEKMRNKSLAGLGPQPEVQLASAAPTSSARAPQPAPGQDAAGSPRSIPSSTPRPQSTDLGWSRGGGGGSGPVGPLFVGMLVLLRRLKTKRA
jgi:Ca-activated chloride channel family protein